MERDPIAEAIKTTAEAVGTALEQILHRGLEVTPTASGCLIRVAPADGSAHSAGEPLPEARSW